MRTYNINCKVCGKPSYRRPIHLEQDKIKGIGFHCKQCLINKSRTNITCKVCKKIFFGKKDRIYCSKSCCGKEQRNKTGTTNGSNPRKNLSQYYLDKLKKEFNFDFCMVKGCTYNKCYELHRFIHGKDGGKYEIGNMFAICPNHHTEIHKKITIVKKINNYTLEVVRVDEEPRC